jgi:hypothetical protein
LPSTQARAVGERAEASATARPRLAPALVVALAAIVILLARSRHYLPFMVDDAFISLRYAERLVAGNGLTWTDGERVEGYTNLLWVLCTAALHALGVDLVVAARLLGLLGMTATLLAVVFAHAPPSARAALPAVIASCGLALTGPVAVWSIGGMEQPLLAALLAWGIVLCFPLLERAPVKTLEVLLPGTLLALACLTRPDGVLFTASACLGILIAVGPGRAAFRTAVLLALPSLLACLGQLLFRLVYYGDWLPNTAYIKLGLTPDRFMQGLAYVGGGARRLAPLLLPAAAGLFAGIGDARDRRRAWLLAVPLVVWCAYVASIGGDIFPAWRHLLVGVVLVALFSAQGVAWIQRRRAVPPWIAWGAAAGLLVILFVQQAHDPESRRARKELWEWNGQVVGRLLRAAFAAQAPLLAVDSAGCLPYFSGLPALDMLGLNDRHIAHHRPPWFGTRQLGHEMGDGAYVLARRPDLVIFCGPAGHDTPCYVSGWEMTAKPGFHRDYTPVVFEGHDPHLFRTFVWARKEYGRIGVERSAARVVVPGFLVGVGTGVVARLDAGGRLVAALPPGGMAIYRGLTLSPGRWTGHVEGAGAPVTLRVHSAVTGKVLAEGERPAFVAGRPMAVDLEVSAAGGAPAEIARLAFARE